MRVALKLLPTATDEDTRRCCGTCLHYQPGPFRRQGWCRNPLLRAERELALVSYDEHRCKRMLDDYWEDASPTGRRSRPDDRPAVRHGEPPQRRRAGSYLYYLYAAPVALLSGALVAAFVLSSPPAANTAPNPATPVVASVREEPAAQPTSIPPAQPTPQVYTVKISNTGGTGAFLRATPGRNGKGIVARADGTPLQLLGEETQADGATWKKVKDEQGNTGWIMAEYLTPVDAPAAAKASTPAPAPTAASVAAGIPGTASSEFWLQSDARRSSTRITFVPRGTSLQLIDSKAGEVVNSQLPGTPSKWYWVRVPTTGESGWAYSGWVSRE